MLHIDWHIKCFQLMLEQCHFSSCQWRHISTIWIASNYGIEFNPDMLGNCINIVFVLWCESKVRGSTLQQKPLNEPWNGISMNKLYFWELLTFWYNETVALGHLPHLGPNEVMTKSKGDTLFAFLFKISQTSSTVLRPFRCVGKFVGSVLEMEHELDVFR